MDNSPRLRSLAVVAKRGTTNNLFQVVTLVRAATALECAVEVLFQDAALLKLRRDHINLSEWSPAYAAVVEGIEQRLRAAEFVDMESFLRDAKQHGDAVHLWACAESLAAHSVSLGDLTPLLDGELPEAAFLEEARKADAVLSF